MARNSSRDVSAFMTLKDALTTYVVDDLKRLAKLAWVSDIPPRKDEIIRVLMKEVDSLNAMSLLSDLEKKALAEAVHAPGGEFNQVQFFAKYGASTYPQKERGSFYTRSNVLLDLFIVDRHVPADLREKLKTVIPEPEEDVIHSRVELPDSVDISESKNGPEAVKLTKKETAVAARQNILTVLRLIESGKVRVSASTLLPTNASIDSIDKHLFEGDWYDKTKNFGVIQSFAWPLLLQAAGFATPIEQRLVLTAKGKKILNREIPAHDAIKTAWGRWIDKGIIDEFNRIDSIKGQKSKGRVLTSPAERKYVIDECLGMLPARQWVSVVELGRYMRGVNLTFDVAHNPWALYFGDRQYGQLGYDGHGGWEILQQRYIQVLLMEYAATLGLIDIAYTTPDLAPKNYSFHWGTDDLEYLSRYDGLFYFRVNELGAYVFGVDDSYMPVSLSKAPSLTILPTGEIIVTDVTALTNPDRLYLMKIAEKISDFQWKMSTKTLFNALENEETPEQIRAFLCENSQQTQLPGTVEALFHEMGTRVLDIKNLGRACFFETENPHIMQLVQADPQLKNMGAPLSDNRFIVFPGKEKSFFKRLNELGYIVPESRQII
jgi:hypothetical protein